MSHFTFNLQWCMQWLDSSYSSIKLWVVTSSLWGSVARVTLGWLAEDGESKQWKDGPLHHCRMACEVIECDSFEGLSAAHPCARNARCPYIKNTADCLLFWKTSPFYQKRKDSMKHVMSRGWMRWNIGESPIPVMMRPAEWLCDNPHGRQETSSIFLKFVWVTQVFLELSFWSFPKVHSVELMQTFFLPPPPPQGPVQTKKFFSLYWPIFAG